MTENKIKSRVRLAWLLCLLAIGIASIRLIGWLLAQSGRPAAADLVQKVGWDWGLPLVFSSLALLILIRQPHNRIGWLLMIPAVIVAIPIDVIPVTRPAALTPSLFFFLWIDGWSWIPIIFAIFLIPLYFPDGRPPAPRWNWVPRLALGMWLFFLVITPFTDSLSPVNYDWTLPNPIGFIPLVWLNGPFLIFWGIGLISILGGSVASLFVRFRRAHAAERQQIKWLLYAGAIFILVYSLVYFLSDPNEFGPPNTWINLLFILSLLAIPAAIAIAILRYRLYDIDVIIRKTAVYALLSALLALVYFGSVVVLQSLVESATGEQSPLAIVLSTLLIAALFNPLRGRVQAAVDRRFFRQKFNAQQVLAAFALTARDETDLETLTAALREVVEETIRPKQVGLWLRRPERK